MKVLFVIEALICGGKERRLTELMKSIKENKEIEFELVVMNNEIHYKEVFDLNINVHYIVRKTKKDISIFSKLYKLCKKFKPDIVHCWDSMTVVYSIPACRLLKIKLVNSMVVDTPVKQNVFNKVWFRAKLTFPFSNIIIGNSKSGLLAYKAPKRKSICIYNGFNFNRVVNRKNFDIIKEKFSYKYIIGMVAAFEERKDYATLVSGAEKVLSNRTDCVFLLLGDGDTKKGIMQMVSDEFSSNILFLGKIDNVEEYVRVFDIGVLCTNSLVHKEGVSNSILEYMAFGKPVIATSGGGTNEIIEDKITGFLITPSSPTELAERIEELLNNDNLRMQMGRAGKQRIENFFSINKMMEKYIEVYKALLSGKINSLL
jgi:glycosyltransferase involved in cell wall biosynthesis